jgi:hypothetical protein
MINVKNEGYIIDESGHTTSYLSDHEISEEQLLAALASCLRQLESLKKVETNLRRVLGIK